MSVDAYRKGDSFYVHFDLPGVDPGSIDLTVERNVLNVHAERRGLEDDAVEMIVAERPRGSSPGSFSSAKRSTPIIWRLVTMLECSLCGFRSLKQPSPAK